MIVERANFETAPTAVLTGGSLPPQSEPKPPPRCSLSASSTARATWHTYSHVSRLGTCAVDSLHYTAVSNAGCSYSSGPPSANASSNAVGLGALLQWAAPLQLVTTTDYTAVTAPPHLPLGACARACPESPVSLTAACVSAETAQIGGVSLPPSTGPKPPSRYSPSVEFVARTAWRTYSCTPQLGTCVSDLLHRVALSNAGCSYSSEPPSTNASANAVGLGHYCNGPHRCSR